MRINAVKRLTRVLPSLVASAALFAARPASAQVTPAAGYTPPDDTPKIGVGVTIFADYTYTDEPKITDADHNSVHKSEFEARRAYINVTGNISDWVSYRVTPDVAARIATTTTSANLPTGATVAASTSVDGYR